MVNKRDWWELWIVLLIVGVVLIIYSSTLNENLQGNFYTLDFGLMREGFEETSTNKIHLRNWVFFYDFTKNKGNISFYLDWSNWHLTYLHVSFPSLIDNETLNIYTIKNNTKKIVNARKDLHTNYFSWSKINYSHLVLDDFKDNYTNEKFVIEFRSNLKPKGRFYFLNDRYNFLHPDSEKGNINFILGNDYQCNALCVYDLEDIKENAKSFDRDLRLKFKGNRGDTDSHFKLNTFSRKILLLKNLFLAGGISLLIALVVTILTVIYPIKK